MARSTLTLLLPVALFGLASGNDFMKHLPNLPKKIQPADITKIAQQSPAQIAKTALETTTDAAQRASKAAEEAAAMPPKEAAAAAEAAVKHVDPQKSAAQALEGAGEELKRAAHVAAAANASVVAKNVEHAADTALPTGMRPKDIQHASKGDVEDTMRKVTPKAAETVNHMGHKAAREIEKQAPRAADLVNRTGNGFVDRMFGPIPEGSTPLPSEIEDKIRGFGWAPIVGIVLVLVISGAVVTSRYFKRRGGPRSPQLLGDGGLEGEEMACNMQMSNVGVTEFSRF